MASHSGLVVKVNKGNVNTSYERKKKSLKIGCFRVTCLMIANTFFAIITILGEVGEKACLPLWIDSNNAEVANSSTYFNKTVPQIDAYFVYSFACLVFVFVFGAALLFLRLFQPNLLGETERKFPHSQLFIIGFFDCLNGVFIVFAGSGLRTAPYLQMILGNFMIPMTIAFRYFILRKLPTRRQFCCAMIVFFSLLICFIPKIVPSMDSNSEDYGGASGLPGILWPVSFLLGYIPAAIMIVMEERSLKFRDDCSNEQVNIVFFYFWTSFYEMVVVFGCFWMDIIPGYGYANGLDELIENWIFGVKCFFGFAGCSSSAGTAGMLYIAMHILCHLAAGLLMRFSEGATLLAIVQALVSPFGFIFWTLFRESPFGFQPKVQTSTWLNSIAILLMVPAIFLYNIYSDEEDRSTIDCETTPLIHDNMPSLVQGGYSFSVSEHSLHNPKLFSNGTLSTFKPTMLM